MILFTLVRKILISLAPLALFFLLRKITRGQHLTKRKSHAPDFDTFDGAKLRTLVRSKTRRSVSTLSKPRSKDQGVEWVDKSRVVEGEIVEEKK